MGARRYAGAGQYRRGGRNGSDVPYDPSQELPTLLDLWASYHVTEAGTGVASWLDHKGLVIDFAQSTDANRPALVTDNTKPAIDFNGTTDRLSVTLSADQLLAAGQPYTVLCWGVLDALKSATQSLIDFGDGRAWVMFETANAGNPIGIFDSVAYRSVGVDPSTGTHLWEWSVIGGANGLTVYQDGAALGTTADTVTLAGLGGSTFLGSIDTGASAHLDGKLKRVLVLNGILGASARARVKAWGTTFYPGMP